MSNAQWRTLIDPQMAASHGCRELHVVCYQPRSDRGGNRRTVAIQIPGAPREQVKAALATAHRKKARVVILCDTHEQANRAAQHAAEMLPEHRRVAYERVADGRFGGLQ